MTIDWKKIRDEQVPLVADDEPALRLVREQIVILNKYPPMEGVEISSGISWSKIRWELNQSLLDEIESYRWRKAGFEPTQEMLDACREERA